MEIVADSLEIEVESSASKAKESLEDMLKTLRKFRNEISKTISEIKTMSSAFREIDNPSNDFNPQNSNGSKHRSKSGYSSLRQETASAIEETKENYKREINETLLAIREGQRRISEALNESFTISGTKYPLSEFSTISFPHFADSTNYKREINDDIPIYTRFADESERASTAISNIPRYLADSVKYIEILHQKFGRTANQEERVNNPYVYRLPLYHTSSANMSSKESPLYFKPIIDGLKEVKGEFFSTHKRAAQFLSSIKRIAMYRAIRAALKVISDGIKTGTDNLYQYSKSFDSHFSKAMDRAASSSLSFKNSVGVAIAPLIEHFVTAIDWATDKLISFNNWISKVGAALRGETSYTIAKRYATEYAEAAEDAAKATKSFTLGFDELNVINPNTGNDGNGTDYKEMFEEATMTNGEMLKIKDTFENIFTIVKSIGAAILAWRVSDKLMKTINIFSKGFTGDEDDEFEPLIGGKKKLGIGLAVFGTVADAFSGYDIGKNGIDFGNMITSILGTAATIAGVTLFSGSVSTGFLIGIPLAIAATFIGFKLGERARIQELYEQSEVYAEIQEWKAKAEKTEKISKQIEINIQARFDKYDDITDTFDAYRQMINDLFDLSDIENKTPIQIELIKDGIEVINNLGLDGIKLEFDEATGKIKQTRDEILNVIDALEKQAKTEALKDFMVEAYKDSIQAEKNLALAIKDRQDIEKEIMNAEALLYEWNQKEKRYNELRQDFFSTRGGQGWTAETIQEYKELNTWMQENTDTSKLLDKQLEELRKQYEVQVEAVGSAKTAYTDVQESLEWLNEESKKLIGAEEKLGDSFEKTAAKAETSASRIATSFKGTFDVVSKQFEKIEALRFNSSPMLSGINPLIVQTPQKALNSFKFPSLFANGGFPNSGDLFIANEQAPELVGHIGSRTAVANNNQIVQAVSQGVYSAVARAMSGTNGGSDGGNYSFNIYIDGKQVNAAVKKAEHERGAKIATAGLVY